MPSSLDLQCRVLQVLLSPEVQLSWVVAQVGWPFWRCSCCLAYQAPIKSSSQSIVSHWTSMESFLWLDIHVFSGVNMFPWEKWHSSWGWEKIWLCNPDWSWTWAPPATASPMLQLQLFSNMPGATVLCSGFSSESVCAQTLRHEVSMLDLFSKE